MAEQTMLGKVCVVTGANSGIGLETSIGLAELGATIVMACRNREKGEAALREVKARSGSGDVALIICDLSSAKSVKGFVEAFKARYERLDVLVNNAGVLSKSRRTTVDGLETTFATNHLGHFTLTLLLLPLLAKSESGRIVNVSSAIQRPVDFDDPQLERGYDMMRAYGASKTANILFTYELAERLKGTNVTVNCLHPGVVATNLSRDTGRNILFRSVFRILGVFYLNPKDGAATTIFLSSSPDVEGLSGRYFVKSKERRSSEETYNPASMERLWQLSERLAGIDADKIIPRRRAI
jgi:NAD(P)-dependent dehydrogenase (short-subunit alcohol dehydrogenase family)